MNEFSGILFGSGLQPSAKPAADVGTGGRGCRLVGISPSLQPHARPRRRRGASFSLPGDSKTALGLEALGEKCVKNNENGRREESSLVSFDQGICARIHEHNFACGEHFSRVWTYP
ncbi:hypothetical protein E2562_004999 [Oryza meyeriana var. granulata]|uniref:Uncharacterized protein n=1 Tax=Oryza meyeriana var. granulata TaxID=110450 RepID=A0A6G1C4C0_9ORYZ|nr:hypothetical protein E2562_004999 [Oryza meyeriana var. granulata]